MFPIPSTEKLIETKVCRQCQASFPITDKDLEFYDKVSPVFGGKKYSIPTPTLCPDCRQQRRLAWRNERKLYKRNCDATGKEIISMYSPDKQLKVYNQTEWWSDKWNPMDYKKNIEFHTSFLNQINNLYSSVPKIALYRDLSMENSDYSNYGQHGKNLYLCVNCYNLSDSFYSTSCFPFENEKEAACVDCEDCADSSHLYECCDLKKCNNCGFSQILNGCFHCWFSYELTGCSYCICCINQTNKDYMILNEPVSKERFEATLQQMLVNPAFRTDLLHKYALLKAASPMKSAQLSHCEDSDGDHLMSCKNVHSSYFVGTTENAKYMFVSGYFSKNAYDGMNAGGKSDGIYEAHHAHLNFQTAFVIDTDDTRECYYTHQCYACKNCFGCIGLRNKQYCILNKQYTKEEYEALVPKIIEKMIAVGEWGEFFPASMSPFGYNETVANEYFPLEKEEALKLGFNWSDYEAPFPKVEKIIPASKLPDDITKIPDDILNWAIECEVTGKPFRIIKQELEFYRKHNLPIPKRHPDQRHKDRMALRNPRKLFERKCDKCSKDMLTTYAPERPEIVYCEACYDGEVA